MGLTPGKAGLSFSIADIPVAISEVLLVFAFGEPEACRSSLRNIQ